MDVTGEQPLKIVVIDDDRVCRTQIKEWIASSPIQVETYDAAESVYQLLVDVDRTADLFLVDEELPGISSAQLVQDIRATRRHRETPIFILCDEFNSNFRDVSKVIGVNGWLPKPVHQGTFSNLLKKIENHSFKSRVSYRIDFSIKMGKLLISWDSTKKKVLLKGALDENAWFGRIFYLVPVNVYDVVIDWSDVHFINVEGVKEWGGFCRAKQSEKKHYTFCNCPPLLVEFMNIMPSYFAEKVTVQSIQVQTYDFIHKRNDIQTLDISSLNPDPMQAIVEVYENDFTKDQEVAGSLINYVSLNLRLAGNPPVAHSSSESKLRQFWTSYLDFMRVVNENAAIEMLLTRETILDQSSQVLARINSFDKAIALIFPEITSAQVTRKYIVEIILDQYRPILLLLESVTKVINILCLKWRRNEFEQKPNEFNYLMSSVDFDFCEKLSRALLSYGVVKKEAHFQQHQSEESLYALTLCCFSALNSVFLENIDNIEEIGRQIIMHLDNTLSIQSRLDTFDKIELLGNVSDEALIDFRLEALLNWEEDQNIHVLVENSIEMLKGVTQDFDRIIVSLMSHDLVEQLLRHRIDEMKMLETDAVEMEFLEEVQRHLVTEIEKAAFSTYFPGFPKVTFPPLAPGTIIFFGAKFPGFDAM